jgi:formiminoglutamase
MKDLSIYFSPVQTNSEYKQQQLGKHIRVHREDDFPELEKGGVAIVHIPEYRGMDGVSPNRIGGPLLRSKLYSLHVGSDWHLPLYDLGDIQPGNELADSFFALAKVCELLVKHHVIPIIVGGSQDLTMAIYKGYAQLEQMVNLCCVDHQLDLGSPEEEPTADGFLSHLLLDRPCYLFNHATIGVQAPYVGGDEYELFEKLYFDACHLGEYNADYRKAEPHLRNADILSIDVNAIKANEINDHFYRQPNGFLANQVCQLSKYAGVSDKLSSLGVFNYCPSNESSLLPDLVAEIIWYFIDGVVKRKGDFPIGSKKDYLRFTVMLEAIKDEIVFYKSNKSERWWMEVPYPPQKHSKYERHHLVPCDAGDYERAINNEMPDLWWKTYQKLG